MKYKVYQGHKVEVDGWDEIEFDFDSTHDTQEAAEARALELYKCGCYTTKIEKT